MWTRSSKIGRDWWSYWGKRKPQRLPFPTKKDSAAYGCLCSRYCYFSSGCHVRFSYFLHTNVDIFKTFACFYLIFDLSDFWWNFWCGVSLDPKKHNSDQKITKNHQKIFLATLLYGICSLCTISQKSSSTKWTIQIS